VTGWGVVEGRGGDLRYVGSGTIGLPTADGLDARLARLHDECRRLLAAWRPEAVVLERAFVARNVQSAFRLGEARGAVLAAVGAASIPVHEYAPAAVKLATAGHGAAAKDAVGRGVVAQLRLDGALAPDASDALALALCHLQQAPLAAAIAAAARRLGGPPRNARGPEPATTERARERKFAGPPESGGPPRNARGPSQ
jgi:crossover junction endodeoxyribonuclease RuvC